jgi:hypothetical protein
MSDVHHSGDRLSGLLAAFHILCVSSEAVYPISNHVKVPCEKLLTPNGKWLSWFRIFRIINSKIDLKEVLMAAFVS